MTHRLQGAIATQIPNKALIYKLLQINEGKKDKVIKKKFTKTWVDTSQKKLFPSGQQMYEMVLSLTSS